MSRPLPILAFGRKLLAPLDGLLLFAVLATVTLGLIIQYSANGLNTQAVLHHGQRIAIGLLALLIVAHIPLAQWKRWTPLFFIFNVILLGVVLFYGSGSGAQRWLVIGSLSVQPSELLKITAPMMLALILGQAGIPPPLSRTLLALALLGGACWLIALQPDLGTAILIFSVGLFVVFLSGISKRWILGFGTLTGISLPFVWQHALHEYQKERIRIFFNPESDPLGSGYNIMQSQIAIGSGGLEGKGWTQSTQAQFDFLPEHSTDFVFSVFAEEFGLFGVTVLIIFYLLILWRMVALSEAGSDLYGRLLAGGLSLSFFLHVLVNIAMTIGYTPVVGSPLPLISYGGSAIVSTLIAIGMVMTIRHSTRAPLT